MAGLLRGVTLHATSEREREEIAAALPGSRTIGVAANIRVLEPPPPGPPPSRSPLRLLFLSRIDRKKNLDYALKALACVRTPVAYDIFGPISDATYWRECQALIAALPTHVTARYCGTLPHAEVHAAFGRYDALLLPTRGENFGHSIVDALAAACPVLISDQTPWLELERADAGWSLPLGAPQSFVGAIEALANTSDTRRRELRQGARAFAERIVQEGDAVSATRDLFLQAIGPAGGAAFDSPTQRYSGKQF
jgi:glycosyltransferase involved in cell wall biosynthesis